MVPLTALAELAFGHPLWLAFLAGLCGLSIAWRWYRDKRSMRSRALSIMAASAPRARSSAARYLLVAMISVATTLLAGQVSWGLGVPEPPTQQQIVSTPLAITASSPNEIDVIGLNMDALVRHGATIEILISPPAQPAETQAPMVTATRTQPPALTEVALPCRASAHPHNKRINEDEACPW